MLNPCRICMLLALACGITSSSLPTASPSPLDCEMHKLAFRFVLQLQPERDPNSTAMQAVALELGMHYVC